MPRQRLTIGTFGDITTRKLPSGRFAARTRYRDWDGHARLVQASGATSKAAERALKAKLADRDLRPGRDARAAADGAGGRLPFRHPIASRRLSPSFQQRLFRRLAPSPQNRLGPFIQGRGVPLNAG